MLYFTERNYLQNKDKTFFSCSYLSTKKEGKNLRKGIFKHQFLTDHSCERYEGQFVTASFIAKINRG